MLQILTRNDLKMNKNLSKWMLALPVLTMFSGCTSDPRKYFKETDTVDTASAYQLVDRDKFEEINLVALLDPTRAGPGSASVKPGTVGEALVKAIEERKNAQSAVYKKASDIAPQNDKLIKLNDSAAKRIIILSKVMAGASEAQISLTQAEQTREARQSELDEEIVKLGIAQKEKQGPAIKNIQNEVVAKQKELGRSTESVEIALSLYQDKQKAIDDTLKAIAADNDNLERVKRNIDANTTELSGLKVILAQKTEVETKFADLSAKARVEATDPEIVKYRNRKKLSNEGEEIDIALRSFHERYANQPELEAKRRDEIQERILAASNQRCNAFKGKLQRDFSRANFWLGAGATATAAAGAIAGTATAAKTLSAFSGLFSGVRAEYDQDFFGNLMVNVIVDGIEARQEEVKTSIVAMRRNYGVDKYPVEAAIADALYFHGQCSIISGLQYAAGSIKTATDPGVDAVARIMLKNRQIQLIADKSVTLDQLTTDIPKLQTLIPSDGIAGNNLVSKALPDVSKFTSAVPFVISLKLQFIDLLNSTKNAVTKLGNVSNASQLDNFSKTLLEKPINGKSSFQSCLSAASHNEQTYYEISAQLQAATGVAKQATLNATLADQKDQAAAIRRETSALWDSVRPKLQEISASQSAASAVTGINNLSSAIPNGPNQCKE